MHARRAPLRPPLRGNPAACRQPCRALPLAPSARLRLSRGAARRRRRRAADAADPARAPPERSRHRRPADRERPRSSMVVAYVAAAARMPHRARARLRASTMVANGRAARGRARAVGCRIVPAVAHGLHIAVAHEVRERVAQRNDVDVAQQHLPQPRFLPYARNKRPRTLACMQRRHAR